MLFLNAQGEICLRRYGADSATLMKGDASLAAGERVGTLRTH